MKPAATSRRLHCVAWLLRGHGRLSVQGALAIVLSACAAAPTTRLHSLVAPAPPAASAPAAPTVAWEWAGVSLPAQVDVPQIVLRGADDTLTLLEHDRWVAPLADEIRAAVGQRLSRVSVAGVPAAAAWHVSIEVRGLEARLGARTALEADWAIRPVRGAGPQLRCHAAFEQPVGDRVSDVAAGHRANVARLADTIAAGLAGLARGGSAGCASGSS